MGGFLNLKFFSERPETQILIMDMLGRVVKQINSNVEANLKIQFIF